MIEFDFENLTADRVDQKRLEIILRKFTRSFYPKKLLQVSVQIVGKKEIIKLNRRFFNQSGLTDIISLESDTKAEPKSLGDIFICSSVAKENAKKLNHSFQKEIEVLFKHGLVHLLGLEHETEKEKELWQEKLKRF